MTVLRTSMATDSSHLLWTVAGVAPCLAVILICPGLAWADVIGVPPSGDVAGVTDAETIESALRDAELGDTVLFTDGDDTTVDLYYTNRVVVVEGFSGTIRGEGQDSTVWSIVPNDVSAFLYDSAYIDVPGFPGAAIWATGLHLEFPGDWELRDMTMIADDPVPVSEAPGGYFQSVAAWGGHGDNYMSHLTFSATADSTARVVGPHIMRGSPRGGPGTVTDGVGDVVVQHSHFENLAFGPQIMWFHSSEIVVKEITTLNVSEVLYLEGFVDSTAVVKDSVFVDSNRGVQLRATPHTTVKDNVFLGVDPMGRWWRAAIYIPYGTTDVTIKGNGFYDIRNVDTDGVFPDGAGAVLVWLGRGGSNRDITIKGNDYDSMEVAIRAYVDGVFVCEEDLEPSQVVGALNKCADD